MDDKQDEDTFRAKLRKCFSNLHTRRGWLYMGIFERSSITNRLHFHALLYIPDGQMKGVVNELGQNNYFYKCFWRNEFKPIFETDMQKDILLSFFMQALNKSSEEVIYSRGISGKRTIKENDGHGGNN